MNVIEEKAYKCSNCGHTYLNYGLAEKCCKPKFCEDCGKEIKLFGESNIEELAKKYDIPRVVKLPLDPKVAKLCDEGKVEFVDTSLITPLVEDIFND